LGKLSTYITRTSVKNQSWIDDICEYGRILTIPVLAFVVFRFMRMLAMDASFVDLLERMDQVATVIIVGALLLRWIIRAVVGIFDNHV
jgi:hypothetical protein